MASEWRLWLRAGLTAILLGVSLTAVPTLAHSPPAPEHGLAPETFYTLFSADRDLDPGHEKQTEGSLPIQELANTTDIPLDSPPPAVEQWNRLDLQNFSDIDTDAGVSVHPPDARLESGSYIADAYVEVFAVQPSTRARLSPSRQPLYVAPSGTVLGVVDFRVDVPANSTSSDRKVYWTLKEHTITTTRVRVDGHVETVTEGTHTPAINYTEIDAYAGETHLLTLEAVVNVTLEKKIREKHFRDEDEECEKDEDNDNDGEDDDDDGEVDEGGECYYWTTTVKYPSEELIANDSVTVTEYDLHVAGFKARYPNGDLGLVIYKTKPWLGYSVPNGDLRGVWRFYSARDKDWDTLVRSTGSGDTTVHSPLHPLQVNAYPMETGPTASPRGFVTVLETYGVQTQPPTLPPHVHLDVVTQPYTASYGIATRVKTDTGGLADVTAWGLVRGVTVDVRDEHVVDVSLNRADLTLTVLNKTEDTVTVRVRLRDANTSESINTIERDGYILLAGDRVNTTGNGTVTETLSRPPGGLTARYEPGAWWRNTPGYTGDAETVLVQGTVLEFVSTLYQVGVPVSLFLLAAFFIDRVTGWRVWPPWRRL